MKKIAVLLCLLLLLGGCRPAEEEIITAGTEDGGGSGYGVTAKSALKLSDFYAVTLNSTRENNLLFLGTPVYSLGESDTYHLSDGSQVVLTYSEKGILVDTLYTDMEDGKSYGLFDKLVQLGVLKNTASDTPDTPDTPVDGDGETNTPDTPDTNLSTFPIFSKRTYRKAAFDSGLSLHLDRNSVLSTFGSPTSFGARSYKKDSYIIDCYLLDDGSTLMLDYGYDRKSLRCAAIEGINGITEKYLGSWSMQSKPADFVRPRVELNQITLLSKGASPLKVYETLGEPAWFEGTASNHRDAYVLPDGGVVYLSYDEARNKLTDAYQQMTDGKTVKVSLR